MATQNSYWKVTHGFEVHLRVGTAPSNVWIGRSNALQTVYRTVRLKRGDEIHDLCGGKFVLHGGFVYEFDMRRFDASEILLHPAPGQPELPVANLRPCLKPTRVKHYRDPLSPASIRAVPLEVVK